MGSVAEGQWAVRERLKSVLNEVMAAGRHHPCASTRYTLVVPSKGDGAMDASNLLKPAQPSPRRAALRRGQHRWYRKHVGDAPSRAASSRSSVDEPSVEDAVSILRGLKERYEVHGVRISDSAIVAAATLSNRCITDRFLPDRAIDLID
jgi:ATP-dependent Clp protease ATP-binding subunit ClpB